MPIDDKLQAEFDRLIEPGHKCIVLGTRTYHGPQWTHVDVDPRPLSGGHRVEVVADFSKKIPLPSEEYDLVFSQECLEHFPRKVYPRVLNEWCRLVKQGGRIMIQVPDFLACCEQVLHHDTLEMDRGIMQLFYGGQVNEYDFHYNGFTPRIRRDDLVQRGFSVEDVKRGFEAGYLQIIAQKIADTA